VALGADAVLLVPELGSELGAEILGLEDLADLDFSPIAEGSALEPLDGLFPGLHLPDPEAGNQLLRLGERSIDDGPLLSRKPDTGTLRAWVKSLAREHHASLHELLVELSHLGQLLLSGHYARLGVLVGFHQHDESHCFILSNRVGA